MKLLLRFNIVLVLIFGCGIALISRYAYNFLMDDARRQVLEQAQLMTASASATKDYTVALIAIWRNVSELFGVSGSRRVR